MSPTATIVSSVTAGTSPGAARPRRLDCHKAIHETKPANSITVKPASAASWWVRMAVSEIAGWPRSFCWAPTPLMYAGSVRTAIAKSTSSPARLRGSSRRMKARSRRPSATTEPTVGTWFSSRCRWATLTAVIEGMRRLTRDQVGEETAGGDGATPRHDRRDRQHPAAAAGFALVRVAPHYERAERHQCRRARDDEEDLDEKWERRPKGGGALHEEQNAGHDVDNQADPHGRKDPTEC